MARTEIEVETKIRAIRDRVLEVMARVEDVDNRLNGAKGTWATDRDQAIPEEAMRKIDALLGTR